ncbi:Fc.00g040460.m01.CDS01 [Cosmosporella sp. VM-42]
MGDSPGSDRPLKRVKYAQQEEQDDRKPVITLPGPMNMGTISPADSFSEPLNEVPMFDNPWMLPHEPHELSSPSQMLLTLSTEDLNASWVPALPVSQPAGLDLELSPTTTPAQPQLQSHQSSQPSRLPRLLPAVPVEETLDIIPQPQDSRKRKPRSKPHLVSPFTDCRDRLGELTGPRYARPDNGQVNGYVKFNWPSRRPSIRSAVPDTSSSVVTDDGVTDIQPSTISRSSSIVSLIGPVPAPSSANSVALSPVNSEFSGWGLVPSPPTGTITPLSPQDSSIQLLTTGEPRMLPPHFGLQARMDKMDRRLWEFYVKNWCPGRSVLSKTNLWLKDFAQMHENEGVRSAIQSLAGVYIYDYLPTEKIRQRINDRYAAADAHFSKLLAAPESSEVGKGSEVITMAVILSMQDVVLTERRLKKPYSPRWLEGFKQGEHFLQVTDPGGRFWRDNNVQLSNLRISQSIIVGRAVILAQPMMALPSPNTLDPEQEARRFGWLLYGTEKDMYEIHGGCGFSKMLLHTMSQVTYCAARLQQEPKSTIVPITAKYLLRQLQNMRQWSSESRPWAMVQHRPATIDMVRTKPDDYIIDTDQDMTDVTAEAWRLPRNHPDVLTNLADLAGCIRIMPTSGSHFTAQAPLLPVFLLGVLATVPNHRKVSRDWFEEVVRTPVRSSVPPLYQALKRIWTWIDADIEVAPHPTSLPKQLGLRRPWWERLVARVHEKEEETLCLT